MLLAASSFGSFFLAMTMTYKVYDCFTYDGEEDCLELRLKAHWEKVDWFVIVEAEITFSGVSKKLSFDAERFAWAMPKIRYVSLRAEEFSACISPWDRERFQRNALRRGFTDAAPQDVVIIADVDEVLRPSKIGPVVPGTIHVFEQLMLYFYCNYLLVSEPFWRKVVAVDGASALKHEAEDLRNSKALHASLITVPVPDAGWHFSYLGGMEQVERKLERFAHQELNTPRYKDKQRNLARLYAGKDIYWRAKRWGRVQMDQADFADPVVAAWFAARPALFAPTDIRSVGRLPEVLEKRRRLGSVARRWEKFWLRFWNRF